MVIIIGFNLNMAVTPTLSICIATRNRGYILASTLQSFSAQLNDLVEIVVVDGASSDNTQMLVESCISNWPQIRYFKEEINSGVDGDFDKAVKYARGKYCWLMSDDDIPIEGAVDKVLSSCTEELAAIIVDAEVYSDDLTVRIAKRRLGFSGIRRYRPENFDLLLRECGNCLSFIGSLIIRRQLWLERERCKYYGTEFVHVGVLFQAKLQYDVKVLGEPFLKIRYGVGNWAKRAFEVWMFKWPSLIWSFDGCSDAAKEAVVAKEPWRNLALLTLYRARGWYSYEHYANFIRAAKKGLLSVMGAWILAYLPQSLALFLVRVALVIFPKRFNGIRWELNACRSTQHHQDSLSK